MRIEQKPLNILKLVLIHLKSKNGFDSAAVLSFSSLFAIVPTLGLIFSVFSLSSYFAELQLHLDGFLFEQLLPQNYQVVNQYIHQFILSAQNLTWILILFGVSICLHLAGKDN